LQLAKAKAAAFSRLPSGLQTDLLAQSGFLAPARPHAPSLSVCVTVRGLCLPFLAGERVLLAAAEPAHSSSCAPVPSARCRPMPTALSGLRATKSISVAEGRPQARRPPSATAASAQSQDRWDGSVDATRQNAFWHSKGVEGRAHQTFVPQKHGCQGRCGRTKTTRRIPFRGE
jgi:hypothetical protein